MADRVVLLCAREEKQQSKRASVVAVLLPPRFSGCNVTQGELPPPIGQVGQQPPQALPWFTV